MRAAYKRTLAVCLLALLLLTAVTAILLSDHDCCGDGCQVCAALSGLRRGGERLLPLLALFACALSLTFAAVLPALTHLSLSPVARCDVMNN